MTKIDGGLRQIFRTKLPSFDFQSIESHSTGKGTPDTNYCFNGCEGWIEYKKTEANKVRAMKPEQVAWCERRLRHGGRVFFAVRQKRREVGYEDVLWLIPGAGARDLYLGGLASLSPEKVAGTWPGGPRAWDWRAISGLLAPFPPRP